MHIVWFHLYGVWKQAKFTCDVTSQESGPFKEQEGGSRVKGWEEGSGGW